MKSPKEQKEALWREFQSNIGADKYRISSRTFILICVVVALILVVRFL